MINRNAIGGALIGDRFEVSNAVVNISGGTLGSRFRANHESLGLSWQQEVALWSGGDFTADGSVNSADLNELGINWQKSIPLIAGQSVPEPSSILLFVAGLFAVVSQFTNSWDDRRS